MKEIILKKIFMLMKKYSTRNPFELCDYLHIKVFFEDLGNINGFYQHAPKNKIIHINSNLDYSMQIITCAHELGHALFHSRLNILFLEKKTFVVTNKFELEANYFAASLLIDNINEEDYRSMTIEQIASALNMSVELVKLKFTL